MAESWRAKANRYARGDFTNKELKVLLGGMLADQVIDVVTYGKLSQLKANAFRKIALPLARRGAVAGVRAVPAIARTAGFIVMRHPFIAAGAAIYVGVTEREKIRALLEQGYDIVEERIPTPSPPPMPSSPTIPGVEEIITGGRIGPPPGLVEAFSRPVADILRRKRKPSIFNKAVKAGMQAVKRSTSYGGIGKIKPAKKAFALVVKLASAKKKKKKAPKSGIRRKVWNAMRVLR